MDGRGRWIDNRFIERLWRSLKYEAVYLQELVGGHHARLNTGDYLLRILSNDASEFGLRVRKQL